MKVVYAISTFWHEQSLVYAGQHWPADDPVVRANPGSFSEDPRWGLKFSVEPEGFRDEVAVERVKRSYVRRAI